VTARERLARALCMVDERNGGAPWEWYRTDRQREHFFEGADAIIDQMLVMPELNIAHPALQAIKKERENGE
jgi:hypothetical protein